MESGVSKIVHGDILEIRRLLEESENVSELNISREVLRHVWNGIALKLVVNGKIAGIWCSLEFEEYTSLSYFYVVPEVRKTLWVLDLFMIASLQVNPKKPVMIKANNTDGFEKYVVKVSDGLYMFKGLR